MNKALYIIMLRKGDYALKTEKLLQPQQELVYIRMLALGYSIVCLFCFCVYIVFSEIGRKLFIMRYYLKTKQFIRRNTVRN